MNVSQFLDEFRPFRRGEIALARRSLADPGFLPPKELAQLRYAIRLAALSTLGAEPDDLLSRIASYRLRLLQLLAPVLPTDPERIDPVELAARIQGVAFLVHEARARILTAGLASEERLDDEIARKQLVLVLGGAAGCGYAFLGALEHLGRMGLAPSYVVGCSIGAILGIIRARRPDFDLSELLDDIDRIRSTGIFRLANQTPRYGLPAALRIDLYRPLGGLFSHASGEARSLGELAIPVDVLTTGLGPGALTEPREAYPHLVDAELDGVDALPRLRGGVLRRVVGALVSVAMSRQVLVPVFFGADPETADLPALDAAGFSAAIPGLLNYDLPLDDTRGAAILDPLFERHDLAGLVDGSLTSLVPARYAWDAVEAGRIGSRNCTVVALDALAEPRGANAVLAPLLRAISATADRDHAFWDLHVAFRKTPALLDLFPSEARLLRASADGSREFADSADLLQELMTPLPPWKHLAH